MSCAIHADKHGRPGEVPPLLRKASVLKLVPRLDALLDLLDATADSLAAERGLRTDGVGGGGLGGDDFGSVIQ